MHLPTPAHGLRLAEVIPNGRWLSSEERRISSCCIEPEQCQQGDLFVAFDDHQTESSQAIDAAIRRGAAAILSERIFPCPLPQFIVDDCRVAYGQLCHALSGNPAGSLRTIGITGSYGKTMTQQLLVGILNAAGIESGTLSVHGLSAGDGESTRLGPAAIANWLANTRAQGTTHALFEASSRALAGRQLSGLMLDAAVITNIRREHVRWHGSIRNYQASKARLLEHLKPGGFAVMNADDPASSALLATLDIPVLTVGLQKPAELSATLIERHVSEQIFLMDAGNESIAVRTRIIGDSHIYNCLSAAAVALLLGIDPTVIVRGLESVETVPVCLQRIECGQPFGVFVDSSPSPEALSNVLNTLREVTKGRLHCVLGVDHRFSSQERARTGRVLEQLTDSTVLTGTRLDRKMALNSAHDILDGFDRPSQAHLLPDRGKAICWSLSQAEPGDIVLLAGGRDSIGPDQVQLSDEDVVRYWLQHVDDNQTCPWSPA